MATTTYSVHRIGVLRAALTGSITASVVFLFCWLGTFVPFPVLLMPTSDCLRPPKLALGRRWLKGCVGRSCSEPCQALSLRRSTIFWDRSTGNDISTV